MAPKKKTDPSSKLAQSSSSAAEQPESMVPKAAGPSKNPDKKAEDWPSKDQPAKDQSAKIQPANDRRAKDKPAKDEPTKDEPTKDEPTKDEPTKDESNKDDQPAAEDSIDQENFNLAGWAQRHELLIADIEREIAEGASEDKDTEGEDEEESGYSTELLLERSTVFKGKQKETTQISRDHIDFLGRLGYPAIKEQKSKELEWTESAENHREARYQDLSTCFKAISVFQGPESRILLLKCKDGLDRDESPMSKFASHNLQIQKFAGRLVVNFWIWGNYDITARELVIWLLGQFIEKTPGLDIALPIDDVGPNLIEVLETILLAQLKEDQIVLIIDGLGLLERAALIRENFPDLVIREVGAGRGKVDKKPEVAKDMKAVSKPQISPKTRTQKAEPGEKQEATKKAESSKQGEVSRKVEIPKAIRTAEKPQASKATDQSQELATKVKQGSVHAELDLLVGLVNMLVSIADRDLGSGYSGLKLILIESDPEFSSTLTAVLKAKPTIRVVDVPNASEFENGKRIGFDPSKLPGPRS